MIHIFLLFSVFFIHLVSNSYEDKVQCSPCKSLIEKSMKYIEHYGIEMFKSLLISQYCEKLPIPGQGMCKKLVEAQAKKIVNWMDNQLCPEEICQALVFNSYFLL